MLASLRVTSNTPKKGAYHEVTRTQCTSKGLFKRVFYKELDSCSSKGCSLHAYNTKYLVLQWVRACDYQTDSCKVKPVPSQASDLKRVAAFPTLGADVKYLALWEAYFGVAKHDANTFYNEIKKNHFKPLASLIKENLQYFDLVMHVSHHSMDSSNPSPVRADVL